MAEPIAIIPRRKRAEPVASSAASRPAKPGGGLQLWLLAATLFGITLLVHAQTLGFPFLMTWDDPAFVVHNPWIRGLTLENLRFAFTAPYFSSYHPLHLVSYMVDYSVWGLNPFGFRIQSLLLAGMNTALAFALTRRLFGSVVLGTVAALLYAVHPSHVEAVAWLSIRKDLLSTFFLLLSVLVYDKATRDGFHGPWYATSVATFLLGLLSKVSISMLPLFLLVLDLTRRWDGAAFSWKRAIATKIPYAVLAGALVVVNDLVQAKTHLPYAHQPLSYLMVKGHSVAMYLGLLAGVLDGRPIYDPPSVAGFRGVLDLAALAFPVLVFALAWSRRQRVLALGTAWIFVLLLPAIAFPLVTYMADRYLYAPSLGFCWILAAGILSLAGRARSEGRRVLAVVAMTAAALTFFVVRTVRYESVWGVPQKLWAYAHQRSHDVRATSNLAQAMYVNHRYDEAEQLYQTIVWTNTVEAWTGIACVYFNTGRYSDAKDAMDRAVLAMGRRRPSQQADVLYLRGQIEWPFDREAAIRDWEEAVRIDPKHERARAGLSAPDAPPSGL
ncbi:MAG TPA: tetratricopeptide repeat protein [Candidatus Eisenbacteria bacterium]|jgi:hypothetical protein|nr:tetratricopeptide repeat protein [Candidatus Eisenbacteria bacterium]